MIHEINIYIYLFFIYTFDGVMMTGTASTRAMLCLHVWSIEELLFNNSMITSSHDVTHLTRHVTRSRLRILVLLHTTPSPHHMEGIDYTILYLTPSTLHTVHSTALESSVLPTTHTRLLDYYTVYVYICLLTHLELTTHDRHTSKVEIKK